jgi:chaperonin cofactor prefoldin
MEELLDKMNKLEQDIKEFAKEKYDIEEQEIDGNDIIKSIKKIEKDDKTNGYIYISGNGMSVQGSAPTIMYLVSLMISKLKENGLDEDLIKKSVEIGVADLEEQEKMLKEKMKKMMEIMEN